MPAAPVEHRTLSTFVVESYWPGVTAASLHAAVIAVGRAAAAMGCQGIRIRYMGSTLVPADETVFCFVEAVERQDVVDLSDRAGLRSDRIIEAVIFLPRVHAGERVSRSRQPRAQRPPTAAGQR